MKYPFIIAEAGINGNGEIGPTKKLVREAKEAGADAVKFQLFTYRARPRGIKFILSKAQWQDVAAVGQDVGIPVFWSVFDFESVDLAAELGAPFVKLSIIEKRNSRLIARCNEAFQDKPRFVSVDLWGQYNKEELAEWHKMYCPNNGWSGFYPTFDEHIEWERYEQQAREKGIGWSDHCPGIFTAVAVASVGATVIEKHFKLDDDCPDAKCSVNPAQFKIMARLIREVAS